MRTVNQINADFAADTNQAAGKRSSESNIVDIFLAELGRLKRIIAGMGLSASDGEDVLQDVAMQALKQSEESRTEQQSVRWLIKVTVNECLTEHRRRRCFRRGAYEILKRRSEAKRQTTRVDKQAIAAEELEIVRESLQELDDSLLGPMVLRYFCDLNSKEVAEILGLRPSTVRSHLRKARMILARRLMKRGIRP